MSAVKKQELRSGVLGSFQAYEYFCKTMLDAYVVVNNQGEVVKNNQLFSTLVGKSSKQIQKAQTLDELLSLAILEKNLSVKDLLAIQTPTRIDEVHGVCGDRDLNLILGIFPFIEGNETHGVFILLRDVTAETNLQGKYKVKATQSITDKLTGLYNRAYLDQHLTHSVRAAVRKLQEHPEESTKISVIMVDIDHFKRINDTHGHQAGDYILEGVARVFKHIFRKSDVLCRYGGEEFIAILHDTDLNGAMLAAEKLREAVASAVYEFNEVKIPVTISLGIAQILLGQETGKEAIARADAALYHSKHNGRNRVSMHLGRSDVVSLAVE